MGNAVSPAGRCGLRTDARSTEEIAEALGRGGLTTIAGSVATILGRDKGGTIARVKRGLWGLKD